MKTEKSQNLDLKMIDKYCLTSNPIYDVIPLKVTFTFSSLGEDEMDDLREFANVEGSSIERWLLVPDCISLGTLGFVVQRAFGLAPFAFTSAALLDMEEQKKIFPTLTSALNASGAIFDNPFDLDYHSSLCEAAAASPIFVPSAQIAMMIEPTISYEEAQKSVWEEVDDIKEKGFDIEGVHYTLESPLSLVDLNGVTKTEEYDWSDELNKNIELKDVLIREGSPRPDFNKRFKGQRSTLTAGRKRGAPFCYKLLFSSFFQEEPSFTFVVERPKSVKPLLDDGYITIESYLESIMYVSKTFNPDLICKKGYDLFCDCEESYHSFIMLAHSPLGDQIVREARQGGWSEPTMDLKRVFRGKK